MDRALSLALLLVLSLGWIGGCAGQGRPVQDLAANEATCARLADEIVTVARTDDHATRDSVYGYCLRERGKPSP